MKEFSTKACLCLASAFSALLASPSLAQQVSASQNSEDSAPQVAGSGADIIVTARRVEEKLQDVPISISVFNQAQLESHNVVSGEDLTKYTPSLSVNTRYGTDRLTFAIRGFNQETGTAPSVGTYFNDVVGLRSATVLVPGGDGAGPGFFFDLQNVQVLKGPQGTLFGLNTTGGAVMLVPKKPTDSFEGFLQGGMGNFDYRELSGVVNLPVSDTFKLRLSVEHKQRDGYMINRSGIGPRDFDDLNYTAVRASAMWNIAPDLENYTVFSYARSHTNGPGAKLTAAFTSPDFLGTVVGIPAVAQLAHAQANNYGFYDFDQSVEDAVSRLKLWQAINTTTWNASDNLTFKNIFSYGVLKSFIVTPLIGTNWNTSSIAATGLAQPGYPYVFFVVHGAPGLPTGSQSTLTEEFRIQGQALDSRLSYQGGIYFESSDPVGGYVGIRTPTFTSCSSFATLTCTNPFTIPLASISSNLSKTWYRDVGLYGQATYKLSDQFKLTGGFRYTWDSEKWDVIATNIPQLDAPAYGNAVALQCTGYTGEDANCFRHLTEKSSAPTWLIDLEYTPTPDYMFYAKYSRGYRAGAVEAAIPAPLTQLKPEKLDAYEVGAKTTFRGAVPGTLNLAAFYNNFFNQQLQLNFNQIAGGPPSTAVPINAGHSRMWGVEASLNVQPVEGLVLTADYTYLNTKILSIPDLTGAGAGLYTVASQYAAGQPLPLSPKNKFVLGANYTVPVDRSVGEISLGVTYSHADSQVVTPGDLTAADPGIRAAGKIGATDLVDLNLTWNSIADSKLDLLLFATNITNQHYYTFSQGTGTTGAEFQGEGAPRMYGVRARINF